MCISLEALCLEIQITVCGIQASGRSKRVEGNYEVLPHSKPWMGLMVNKKYGPFCSAFLINLKPGENHSDMALTAAHCLPNYDVFQSREDIYVVFGKHNKWHVEPSEIKIRVDKYMRHMGYLGKIDSDIGLIKLAVPIEFSETVQPIALASSQLQRVHDCYLTGWGGQISTLGIVFYNHLEYDEDAKLYIAEKGHTTTVNGDSGSPMICRNGSSYEAHGIAAQMNYRKEEDSVIHIAKLTDIAWHLPWILERHNQINHPNFIHPLLLEYDMKTIRQEWSTVQTLIHYLMAFNNYLPDGFGKRLEEAKPGLSNFPDKSFHGDIYVFDREFNLRDIIGYINVENATHCAVICFNGNYTCNYVPSMKQCYIADTQSSEHSGVQLKEEQSIMILIEGRGKSKSRLNNKSSIPSPPNRMKILDLSILPLWSISLSVKSTPLFHCTGRMVLRENRSWIESSTACLSKLTSGLNGMRIIVNIDIVWEKAISNYTEEIIINGSAPILSIPVPDLCSFRHETLPCQSLKSDYPITEIPQINKYYPSTGSFLSEPYSMPWLVFIHRSGLGKRICYGILLNESAFTGAGRVDRTRFILTSKLCTSAYAFYEHAYAGTYYPFKNSPYEQKQEIEKYHHHPDFEDVNVTTTDLQELFMRYPDFEREWKTQLPSRRQFFFNDWLQKVEGPEIMELADDIFFDANVQPLPLESDQPIIFDGMGLFTVDWDQKNDANLPLYVTPLSTKYTSLKTDGADFPRKITTERTFYKNRGGPLLFCNEGKIGNRCQILGFRTKDTSLNGNSKEEYVTIYQYVDWIREIMKKLIDEKFL